MTCQAAIISCANAPDISLVIGIAPVPTGSQGTIVFFSGGNGEIPAKEPDYEGKFQIVDIVWDTPWESGGDTQSGSTTGSTSILYAACRPATALKYVYTNASLNNSNGNGAMCAQGASAGSAAIAYSMVWYGAG